MTSIATISYSGAWRIADAADAELYADGKTCIGFVHSKNSAYDLVFAVVDELGTDAARDMFRRVRTDTLGLDIITYFPGMTVS